MEMQIPETMWRAAKMQDPSLVIAVAETWSWIHYLVEPDIVDMEHHGIFDDNLTAQAVSKHAIFYMHTKHNYYW